MLPALDRRKWKQYERKLGDEFAFAASLALNDAAFETKSALNAHVDERSDRGATKFSQNAFAVTKKATKRDLEVDVIAKDKQAAYLIPALFKSKREKGDYATSRRAGVMVPGSYSKFEEKLTVHGNLGSKALRTVGRAKHTFFGKAFVNGSWMLGVWRRQKPRGRPRRKTTKLRAVAIFQKSVTYQRPLRLDLMGVSGEVEQRVVRRSMERAIREIAQYGRVRSGTQRRRDDAAAASE